MLTTGQTDHFEPFPLTDTQQAYLLGRTDMFELGNVTTHAYFEFEGTIDTVRFSLAWQRLLERHDMLRAIILPDSGEQRVLADLPQWTPREVDLRGRSPAEVAVRLDGLRGELSHEVR